jgi:hypothetical protein
MVHPAIDASSKKIMIKRVQIFGGTTKTKVEKATLIELAYGSNGAMLLIYESSNM